MPRNRSEKSPSGDFMIDDYLRAWMRWYLHIDACGSHAGSENVTRDALFREKDRTYDLLSAKQKQAMNDLSAGGSLSQEDVFRLYGHEPEFDDATK